MRRHLPDAHVARYDGLRMARGRLRLALEQVLVWLERSRQRRHLMGLDDRLLKDIGLSRADIHAELAKPFWRP